MSIEDLELSHWDSAEILDSNEMIIEYLNMSTESEREFLESMANVVRAKAMEELAKKVNISRDDIFDIFNAYSIQSPETVNKILKALDVDFTYIPHEERISALA